MDRATESIKLAVHQQTYNRLFP